MASSASTVLSVVVPSFEKHLSSFATLLKSMARFCQDLEKLELVLVIERKNLDIFSEALNEFPSVGCTVVCTEDVLERFGTSETPGAFLKRIGKFTFQTVKKYGGVIQASAEWVLVLDSESEFLKPFSVAALRADYIERKYVFYTRSSVHGVRWDGSQADVVTRNAAKALNSSLVDLWFLEYYAWFYEKKKVQDLLERIGPYFWDCFTDQSISERHFFENVLYYMHLYERHADEYDFVDFLGAAAKHLPPDVFEKIEMEATGIFSEIGIFEYVQRVLDPADISAFSLLFEHYKLPFMRFEPPVLDRAYLDAMIELPYFCVATSSHCLLWTRKRIAVCLSGTFNEVQTNILRIKHFLAGVKCDIYLHGWSNENEGVIQDQLQPRVCLFEPKPDLMAVATAVQRRDPTIDLARVLDHLAIFYSVEACSHLLRPFEAEHDFVMRLRPDACFEISLREVLNNISAGEDPLLDALYLPNAYCTQTISDQIAFGSTAAMRRASSPYSYVKENAATVPLETEKLLFGYLLAQGLRLITIYAPYVLPWCKEAGLQELVRAEEIQKLEEPDPLFCVSKSQEVTERLTRALDPSNDRFGASGSERWPRVTAMHSPSCTICASKTTFYCSRSFNCFHSTNAEAIQPHLGVSVIYWQCENCDFIFTNFFESWTATDFAQHLFNEDFEAIDPDFALTRPEQNAKVIAQVFGLQKDTLRLLDYGQGAGHFADLLRAQGFDASSSVEQTTDSAAPVSKVNVITCFEATARTCSPTKFVHDVDALLAEQGMTIFSVAMVPDDPRKMYAFPAYLTPRNGRAFFYSKKAMQLLFKKFGFGVSHLKDTLYIAKRNARKSS